MKPAHGATEARNVSCEGIERVAGGSGRSYLGLGCLVGARRLAFYHIGIRMSWLRGYWRGVGRLEQGGDSHGIRPSGPALECQISACEIRIPVSYNLVKGGVMCSLVC